MRCRAQCRCPRYSLPFPRLASGLHLALLPPAVVSKPVNTFLDSKKVNMRLVLGQCIGLRRRSSPPAWLHSSSGRPRCGARLRALTTHCAFPVDQVRGGSCLEGAGQESDDGCCAHRRSALTGGFFVLMLIVCRSGHRVGSVRCGMHKLVSAQVSLLSYSGASRT